MYLYKIKLRGYEKYINSETDNIVEFAKFAQEKYGDITLVELIAG